MYSRMGKITEISCYFWSQHILNYLLQSKNCLCAILYLINYNYFNALLYMFILLKYYRIIKHSDKLIKIRRTILSVIISTAIDIIKDIGITAVTDKFGAYCESKEISSRLENYLQMKLKENWFASREEEIDFGGLAKYIKGDLIDDVSLRLFGTKEQRGEARQRIMDKAALYAAQEHSRISQERAKKLVADSLDILRDYFHNNIPREQRQLAGEITDDVCEHVDAKTQEIKDEFAETSIMSIDKNVQLLRNGNIRELEENLTLFMNSLGAQHELAPWYGCKLHTIGNRTTLISVPKHPDAHKMYPPSIKGIAKLKLEGVDHEFATSNVFDYANRHQMKIIMTVQEAEKYLGTKRDPFQIEAEQEIGKQYVILPKPFPPAFACKVIGDDKVVIEYLLLRTVEILDDGTYIVTNDEQKNRPFKVTFRLNMQTKSVDYSLSADEFGNQGKLQVLQTIKNLSLCNFVTLFSYEYNHELITGKINSNCYTPIFASIDEDIEFCKKVVNVEKYFDINIKLPQTLTESDIESLYYIAELIRGDVCEFNWETASGEFELNEKIRTAILNAPNKNYTFAIYGHAEIELWGHIYSLDIERICLNAMIDDYDRLQKKIRMLDIGDPIRIKYVPSTSESIAQDRLKKGKTICIG